MYIGVPFEVGREWDTQGRVFFLSPICEEFSQVSKELGIYGGIFGGGVPLSQAGEESASNV